MPKSSAARSTGPASSPSAVTSPAEETLALLDQLAAAQSQQSPSPSLPQQSPLGQQSAAQSPQHPHEHEPGTPEHEHPGEPVPPRVPDSPESEEPEEEEPDEPDEEDEDDPRVGIPADPPGSARSFEGSVVIFDEDDLREDSGPSPLGQTVIEGEIVAPVRPSPDAVRYESRITVLEAWQYPGNVAQAPAWVDRNWIAYATDADPLRQLPPGPCLKVPLPMRDATAIARVGDYLALQKVEIEAGVADTRVEVWPRSEFQKLFMPRRVN